MTLVVALVAAYLALLTVGLLWLADRHAHRRSQQQAANPDLTALVGLVDRLCQRVQAPQTAVWEHTQAVTPEVQQPEPVDMFDDQDHWESKEMLAARSFDEELTEVPVG